jgi:hypothetical protein
MLRRTRGLINLLIAGSCLSACSSGTAEPGNFAGSTSVPAATGGGAGTGNGGAGGAVGGAGGGANGGTGATSLCNGAGTRILSPTGTLIDDFEGAAISPAWSSFSDLIPVHDVFKIMQVTTDGAAGTLKSGRYSGTGAITVTAGGFGVGLAYNVAIDPAAGFYCIDISAFDGVSFWAKAATAGSTISINFVLPETNAQATDAQGRPAGGDCLTGCFAHPHKVVTLSNTWAQYTATFAEAIGGSARVQNRIQLLVWLSPDVDWDFSLDEIAFYKGAPPAGKVGP